MDHPPDWAVTASAALERIDFERWVPFAEVLAHGTLMAGYYAPRGEDHQQPHTRDEVYVVVTGSGEFVRGDERVAFSPGDLLFVPAHLLAVQKRTASVPASIHLRRDGTGLQVFADCPID